MAITSTAPNERPKEAQASDLYPMESEALPSQKEHERGRNGATQ